MSPYTGYVFFNLLGLVAAFVVMRRLRFDIYDHLTSMDKSRVTMGLVLGVILGSKIPVLISYGLEPEFFWTGKSLYGALLGAYTGVNLVKRYYRIQGNYGDRYVIPLCIAVALGDIGCYVNGCCGGLPTTSRFHILDHSGIPVYPTQIYTSVFHILCTLFFYVLYTRRKWIQLHFVIYLFLYSIYRFFIEFLRNEPRVFMGWTVYQWIAFFCTPYFAHVLYRRVRQGVHQTMDQEIM
jgi:prolipoprotein diacylglyceryltransferase